MSSFVGVGLVHSSEVEQAYQIAPGLEGPLQAAEPGGWACKAGSGEGPGCSRATRTENMGDSACTALGHHKDHSEGRPHPGMVFGLR